MSSCVDGDTSSPTPFTPLVCIVDFHHARGPEVERWIGCKEGEDPGVDNGWDLLPFLALPDGSHASHEEVSYFTLRRGKPDSPTSSVFGIACTRQLDASLLQNKPADVTRSSVQKAVVAVIDNPYLFARIREKLVAVTQAWFAQKDFSDFAVVEQFHDSLMISGTETEQDTNSYVGVSLREFVHTYKHLTLVLFKCALLQPKMLFFSQHCEKMCLLQFTLISLIPGLIRSLRDCADPSLNTYEETLERPTSLKTSDRSSLLAYMGLPLQIFGKGSLFGPYTPLQQLDVLGDFGTKSYIAGSTNTLLLLQRDRYSDVMINLDEQTVSIYQTSLKPALGLTAADRRWIDGITQSVNETWDPDNPTRPTNHGYAGSEEAIRLQFEEYLLSLISAVVYRQFVEHNGSDPKALLTEASSDPASDFGAAWVDTWMKTDNYRLFSHFTDSNIFDVVEPRHPCAGAFTFEDVQRRVQQQLSDWHMDDRLNETRDAINKQYAAGSQRVSSAFNKVWSDFEVLRENQRRRAEDRRKDAPKESPEGSAKLDEKGEPSPGLTRRGTDWTQTQAQAQATMQAAGARASAVFSSWSSWASEKKNNSSWGRRASAQSPELSRSATPKPSEKIAEENGDGYDPLTGEAMFDQGGSPEHKKSTSISAQSVISEKGPQTSENNSANQTEEEPRAEK